MAASASRRQSILLASLLVVLALVVAYQVWWPAAPPPGEAGSAPPGQRTAAGQPTQEVPDVRLEALEATRPAPVERGRNPFRDRPDPPPAPPPAVSAPPGRAEAVPPGPPPVPPITLKYIGLVEAGGRAVAVLSDGRDILYGREGEVVDGRYLIVKINVETIEVSYPDGSGRRLIRLTG
ncbi:MAG TPA: hypothetical protein VK911_08985 [Vicinamibacterales bacterium]|nr:hypothetical protein [Vicinamibacterales bacterium]